MFKLRRMYAISCPNDSRFVLIITGMPFAFVSFRNPAGTRRMPGFIVDNRTLAGTVFVGLASCPVSLDAHSRAAAIK
jgi:hypothetical protein